MRLPCEVSLDPGQLYDDHAQALFAFALNLTRSDAEARDALHEVFARISARPGIIAELRNARHFLLRLTHRAVIDAHRRTTSRERVHRIAADEAPELFARSEDPDTAEFRNALARSLAALPEDQRAVVHLKLWEELTFAEIAEALEIPANTAASRYRYGLEKLRELLLPIYRELEPSTSPQP